MTHSIRKVEYITGDTRISERMEITTDDIEKIRKEFRELMRCDKVNFTYDSINDKLT